MSDLCDQTLDRLGDLSREVHVEVYSYFDVLTGVRTLAVFLRTSKTLTEAPIRSLGKGLWIPLTCVLECARTLRTNRCGV